MMKIKVKNLIYNRNGIDIVGKYCMDQNRIIGTITKVTADFIEMEILDSASEELIKNGLFNPTVSIGSKVISDDTYNQSKVEINKCGYLDRIKKLGISQEE